MLSNDRKLKNIKFSFIDKVTKQSRTVNLIEHDNIDVKYYGANNKIKHTYGEIIKIGEYADSGKKYILVLDYDYYAEENIHSIDLTKLYTIINVVHSSEPYSFSPVYCADETVALVKAEGTTFKFTTNGRDWIAVEGGGGGGGVTPQEVQEMIDASIVNFLTADQIDEKISQATSDFVTSETVDEKIADAVEDLATEEFVSESIATAVEPLATKEELDEAIEEVKEQVVGAFHFRGTVDTVEDLENIADPEEGDVYEVLADESEWAFNGTEWIELGSKFDLSDYYTKAECNANFDANGAADAAETAAKAYADENFDAKGAAAQALQDAKDYADANFDTKGSAAQAYQDAKYYADTADAATLRDAQDYADEHFDVIGAAATAESNANTYTDDQIAAAIAGLVNIYQKCVEHGYVGTEEEFYDDLADVLNHREVITTTVEVVDDGN